MRIRSGKHGWKIAIAAATAVVVAGIGYVSSGAVSANDADRIDAGELRELLLPADDHPVGEVIEASFEEATAEGMLALPEGMQMRPDACFNYFEPVLGPDTRAANGWMQFGPAEPAERAQGIFVSWVVEVRGGAPVAELAATALRCEAGEVTLDRQVSGQVANAEAEPLPLERAETAALTQTVEFPPPESPEDAEILTRHYGPSPDGVHAATEIELVGIGEVLIMVLATDPELADYAATTSYERALEAGIG